jgi:hypothetical protein
MQKDGSFRHGPFDHQSDCNEDRLRPPDCDPIAIRGRLRRLHILNMILDPVISFRQRRPKKEKWPGGRRNSLKSLDSRKEKAWILLPSALDFLPHDLDFPSNGFENPSTGFVASRTRSTPLPNRPQRRDSASGAKGRNDDA